MTGVFVSYSRKDSAVARKLIEEFKAIDLDVWVDWEDIPPAVGWLDQILQGIEEADAFIFLISPDSIASEVCKVELNHAHKNAKRIIPIVVRDVTPKEVEEFVRDLNWIFIRETDDFTVGLDKVKVAINIDIEWLQEHRRLQVRALEWDRKKDASLLLRGRDLRNANRMIVVFAEKDPLPSDLQRHYITFSRRDERLRTAIWISAVIVLLVTVFLSLLALDQRNQAVSNAQEADAQRVLAQKNEKLANDSAHAALAAKASAEENEVIAKAQRSAARAQIYQSRSGGLFTSTLLAIDSYQRNSSVEAEGILRKNISLLPIPVAQIQHEGSIIDLEVSPDGNKFVSSGEDGSACLTRFEDGESLFCTTSSGSVLDATFSPDGKILVTSDDSGEVQIIDAENGDLVKKINLGVSVRAVNISPDGKLLAMARDDSKIDLIKLSNYELSAELSVYGSLQVTAFSPDGLWFAAASNLGSITFWNLHTGQIINSPAHKKEVYEIAFSPDSQQLISGSADNYAVLTSPYTGGELLRVLNEDRVTNVAFSPDGTWFVTSSDDFRIRIWDVKSGEERLRMLQDSIVQEVKISPDGLWIASTGSDRTVRIWDTANGAEIFQIPIEATGTSLAFSSDSSYIVTGDMDGQVSIWNISALQMTDGFLRFTDSTENIKVSPNGDWFAASTKAQVWLLDPVLDATQTVIKKNPLLDFGANTVYDIAISPNGDQMAISLDDGQVIISNLVAGSYRTLVNAGARQRIAYSPDGNTLILGSEAGLLQRRGLDGSESGVIYQSDLPIYSLSVSSTNLAALGLDDKVIVVDLTADTVVSELDSSGKNQLVEFNPEGKILSANTLTDTHIWQAEVSGFEQVAVFAADQAFSMAFNPGGDRLLLGEQDQIIIVNAATGEEVYRIRQKGDVTSLAYSPDGKQLFSSSLRTILFYDTSVVAEIQGDAIVNAACSRLTKNFSQSEWTFFFGDEEYRTLCEGLPVP